MKRMTIGELAKRLRITPKHAGRLADAGRIPSMVKTEGGHRRFGQTLKFKRYLKKYELGLITQQRLKRLENSQGEIHNFRQKWKEEENFGNRPRFVSSPGQKFFRATHTALAHFRHMLIRSPLEEWTESQLVYVLMSIKPFLEIKEEILASRPPSTK